MAGGGGMVGGMVMKKPQCKDKEGIEKLVQQENNEIKLLVLWFGVNLGW